MIHWSSLGNKYGKARAFMHMCTAQVGFLGGGNVAAAKVIFFQQTSIVFLHQTNRKRYYLFCVVPFCIERELVWCSQRFAVTPTESERFVQPTVNASIKTRTVSRMIIGDFTKISCPFRVLYVMTSIFYFFSSCKYLIINILYLLFSNKRRQKYCFYVLYKLCVARKDYLFSSFCCQNV